MRLTLKRSKIFLPKFDLPTNLLRCSWKVSVSCDYCFLEFLNIEYSAAIYSTGDNVTVNEFLMFWSLRLFCSEISINLKMTSQSENNCDVIQLMKRKHGEEEIKMAKQNGRTTRHSCWLKNICKILELHGMLVNTLECLEKVISTKIYLQIRGTFTIKTLSIFLVIELSSSNFLVMKF